MTKNTRMSIALGALMVAGIAAACSDSKKETPSNIIVGDGGESATGGKPAQGGAAESGGTTSTTGAAGSTAVATGGTTAVGTAGASSVAGAGNCEDAAKNCYKCAATTNAQIIRACTDASCTPFDNKTLTKLVNGTLPALP